MPTGRSTSSPTEAARDGSEISAGRERSSRIAASGRSRRISHHEISNHESTKSWRTKMMLNGLSTKVLSGREGSRCGRIG
jgi:hypothetical protein